MNLFTKLFTKSKVRTTIQKVVCEKHGVVPNFLIACEGKQYPACGHCIGEIVSKRCKFETIELEQK